VQHLAERAKASHDLIAKLVASSLPVDLLNAMEEVSRQATRLQVEYQAYLDSSEQWATAVAVVVTELPKRGWYLSGKEPSTFFPMLAALIRSQDWSALDAAVMTQAEHLRVDVDRLVQSLEQRGVPHYCTSRVRIFFEWYRCQEHELATIFGLPLIDELCRHLYAGKDFTTKRAKQPKPQIACKTASSPYLTEFASRFVQQFGLIHEDVDAGRLEDPEYFNRSAILHGLMRRAFGPKDCAKTLMVLLFLVFAYAQGDERHAT
jgi:hypothetical protein